MISFNLVVWGGFLLLIVSVLALDLGVFNRKSHVISLPEAIGWTTTWVVLALVFGIGVFYLYELNPSGWDIDTDQLTGREAVLQYLTGYIVEKSLSIDNVFVIAMIFAHFRVPLEEQHRVLFWGIFGAIVLRAIMITSGIALFNRFDFVAYIFGAILIYSAAKMLVVRHDTFEPDKSQLIRAVKRVIPVTNEFHGDRFLIRQNGVLAATPLLLALVMVEVSDIAFALDSIPAILAITSDPFIVFTSNVFAILGLRSLYFVLAGLMEKFRYLKMSLVFLLAYIGVKMLLLHHFPIPNAVSLAIIGGILAVGILASLFGRDTAALVSPLADEIERIALVSYRQAKRAVILILGSSVLLIGIAMLVLPGPAILFVPLGLSILAIEFAWAKRWLDRVNQKLLQARQRVSDTVAKRRS